MTAPIIVPDDDTTAEVIRDAILRATGYSPVTADVILRALRLHSDHHGIGAATIDALWQLRLYVRTAETHDLIATRVVEAYMARRKTVRLADLVAGTGYERTDR